MGGLVMPNQDPRHLDETDHHRLRLELSGIPYRPLAPPMHHDIVLRGMRFHYVEWGDRSARPILFLHGGGQTCRTWDVVCHELSRNYRCIALDQRGHGDSEWSYEFDYGIEAYAADTAALIDALDLAPLVIVGMSLGGVNGLHYALAQPLSVAGFVAVDVGPWVDVEAALPIREFMQDVANLDRLEEFVAAALRLNPRRDARLLRHSLWHNLRRCPDGSLMWKTDLRRRGERGAIVAAALGSLRERIGDLRCPTLVVRGGESRILREEDARRFAAAIPHGRWLVVEGAGHNVQGDQPKALVEALYRFLCEIGAHNGHPGTGPATGGTGNLPPRHA
jgi:pimeloyl-ACP methyl ester carboxylesterase